MLKNTQLLFSQLFRSQYSFPAKHKSQETFTQVSLLDVKHNRCCVGSWLQEREHQAQAGIRLVGRKGTHKMPTHMANCPVL